MKELLKEYRNNSGHVVGVVITKEDGGITRIGDCTQDTLGEGPAGGITDPDAGPATGRS